MSNTNDVTFNGRLIATAETIAEMAAQGYTFTPQAAVKSMAKKIAAEVKKGSVVGSDAYLTWKAAYAAEGVA